MSMSSSGSTTGDSYSCIRNRMGDRCVELCTEQHHRSAEVEVEEQTYCGAKAPVSDPVVGEVGQVERKPHRGDRPEHYRERRARNHRPEALLGVGTETV